MRVLLAVSLLGLSACGEKIDAVQPRLDGTSCTGTTTFEGQAKAIFASYCTVCHASTRSGADRNGAPSGVDFDLYASAVARAEAALGRIQSGAMPPGSNKVPAAESATLSCWILGGKQER